MKTLISVSAVVLMTSAIVAGQRPFFAGSKPIGFPETPNRTTTTPDPLDNRFGEGTTQRLPIEANGDRDLIDRLSKLPIDKQPFWFINWQALEANRKDPQTYPQRPSVFVDPIPSSGNGLGDRFSDTGLTSNVNPSVSSQSNNNGNSNSNAGFGSGQFSQASASASSQSSNNFNSNPGFGGFGQIAPAAPSLPNQPSFNPNFGSNDKTNQVAQTTVVSPTLASSYNPNFDSNHGFYDISGQYIQTPPIVPYQPSNNFNHWDSGSGNKKGQLVQTTQRYPWNAFTSTNSQFNRYPEYNTQRANTKNTGH